MALLVPGIDLYVRPIFASLLLADRLLMQTALDARAELDGKTVEG
jgi:hypothetical protein